MAAANLPLPTTVARVPPTLMTASSTPWPAILLGVAVVVAVCLWLLFRSGSMADRARDDHPEDEIDEAASGGPGDQPADGGR
jgi:hypothetical protein